MNTAKQIIEQRTSKRFHVQTGVLARPKVNYTKVCHIVDVSEDGLCFTYVARERWHENTHLLNIFFPLKGFLIKNIPFEAVYDFVTNDPHSALPLRRRGGRFGKLTSQQRIYLKQFIKTCTTGEVEDQLYSVIERQPSYSLVVTPDIA